MTFLEAAAELTLAGLQLAVVRFPKLAARLGRHMAESSTEESSSRTEQARRIQWAVESAARVLPWKPVCLPQAVAATRMLRRRDIRSTLYLGVDPSAGFDAHAWVRVGTFIVTGGPRPDRFAVVSTFA